MVGAVVSVVTVGFDGSDNVDCDALPKGIERETEVEMMDDPLMADREILLDMINDEVALLVVLDKVAVTLLLEPKVGAAAGSVVG